MKVALSVVMWAGGMAALLAVEMVVWSAEMSVGGMVGL